MRLCGIRGATTVTANNADDILRETEVLLREIVKANSFVREDVVSIIFTTTPDLTAEFPAKACRIMGWHDVPLMGAVEADVPHGVPLCVRVLFHVYLDERSKAQHVYLREARKLRPDLVKPDLKDQRTGKIGQIAIDGPAGSGKSSVAKLLAERLRLTYIDTGAMYRALTLVALDKEISLADGRTLSALAAETGIQLVLSKGKQLVFCQDRNVTEEIRSPLISRYVSQVAGYEGVRREMVKKQQELAAKQDVIMDGRDIGTVVLPFATHKFYLTASLEERARRRYRELMTRGYTEDYEDLKREMERRDYEDETRKTGPLRPSPEAYIIDTTGLTLPEVVEIIEKKLEQKNSGG